MFKIGNIEIKNNIGLAPMAGLSNYAFIKICEEMGAGFAITELISAEAIIRDNKKTFDMLNGLDKIKIPVGIQLFGSNKDTISNAAYIICKKYPFISFIDINMGCPVPKVAIKARAGSGLLKDPNKIYEIVSAVVNKIDKPVTCKIRSGWDNNNLNYLEVSKKIEEAGASALIIHPRTRSMGYSGKSNWNIIKEIKENINIPVIGNGDINNEIDAKNMFELTKCDAIMIARGAMHNPFIFKEINYYLKNNKILNKPDNKQKIDLALKHFNYLLQIKNENVAVLEMRSIAVNYLKGIENSSKIKEEIFKTKNKEELIKILEDYKKTL